MMVITAAIRPEQVNDKPVGDEDVVEPMRVCSTDSVHFIKLHYSGLPKGGITVSVSDLRDAIACCAMGVGSK